MIPWDGLDPFHVFELVLQPMGDMGLPSPALNQTVVVKYPNGFAYSSNRIRAVGRLHVRVELDDGFIVALYDIDAEQLAVVPDGQIAKWPWLVIAAIPAIGILIPCRRWFIRRRLRRVGCCLRCGYDLRATPDRCPECGTFRVAEATLPVGLISVGNKKPG